MSGVWSSIPMLLAPYRGSSLGQYRELLDAQILKNIIVVKFEQLPLKTAHKERALQDSKNNSTWLQRVQSRRLLEGPDSAVSVHQMPDEDRIFGRLSIPGIVGVINGAVAGVQGKLGSTIALEFGHLELWLQHCGSSIAIGLYAVVSAASMEKDYLQLDDIIYDYDIDYQPNISTDKIFQV
ncbi:hypothetical protein ARMGADRAFT_1037755 [Armillaria gallica]|uniref:Uncharacterized protein n=1 Tax=Armillaria gallica TaxID=47427 RepID=A0A2H3D5I1_ARMGA|nr:hypothetical protein ARMGADRAFT_1037755 [Armillaria gallica]